MRLIDLISFIRLSSETWQDRTLSDDRRLALIKSTFPRHDLLKWFDGCAPIGTSPFLYFPFLVMLTADYLGPAGRRHIRIAQSKQIEWILRSPAIRRDVKNEFVDLDAIPQSLHTRLESQSDHISLIEGLTIDPEKAASLIEIVFSTKAVNARRILIGPATKLDKPHDLAGLTTPNELIYQGRLLHWPERDLSVIFSSYQAPGRNIDNR